MTVRHGMGHHNDGGGAASFANRDATLNSVGQEQAKASGEALLNAGVLEQFDLVVVSPFTRTLETAAHLMGVSPKGGQIPTIVHPLAAEHTLRRAVVQQGDRGSTTDTLRKQFKGYPQYDFATVDSYCCEKNIKGGKWWHHGADRDYETPFSFKKRAAGQPSPCTSGSSSRVSFLFLFLYIS